MSKSRRVMSIFSVLASYLVASAAIADSHEPGSFVETTRQGVVYSLFVPSSYDRRAGAAAIVFLHGAGDNHANTLRFWKAGKFMSDWICIAVNARANGAWRPGEEGRVIEAVDEVASEYTVRRLFVGGFSRGGGFSYSVGLAHGDKFAGILCVSGNLWDLSLPTKATAGKVSVAIVHGERDSVVPATYATRAKQAFERADWERLYFRIVPGLGHQVSRSAFTDALKWLDENSAVLKNAQECYEYGLRMYKEKKYGRASWALEQIPEDDKLHARASRYLKRIARIGETVGKKLKRMIEADRNDKWLEIWDDYKTNFSHTEQYAEVTRQYDLLEKKHREAAEELIVEARKQRAEKDVKDAIACCLRIRRTCYLATGKAVKDAKDVLRSFRDDPEIYKRYRAVLKGTESW